ncbi:MAG: replication-associated recombination protein A [Fibrobacter sp.]|jgi:putative ATPase|uniref:replication-associated recombination protein A n=1 Tax=Fibrobacter sp. UWP2 TaxID=1896216 RepID=UPI000917DAF8|nr:replication-associated recombination protein A [Fibrobacter sp. UWP2]MBO7383033.1 replication-associated recombination protein A [Fibrobacter sp.]MCR5378549.1 replication-associated recombination protein A [Fibrobacter sp.]SHJ41876.1 putative ATPase [Fibrobacter sp. UWP2]
MDQPLAERLRPQNLDEFLGQNKILGEQSLLRKSLENDSVPSMIFWGPPGCGKTSLAHVIKQKTKKRFISLSAVSSGVKEVKEVLAEARKMKGAFMDTILFIDEIHRFNKGQQDALLGAVEDGTVTLIGATTENPGFEVNGALLSRCQLILFAPLSKDDLRTLIFSALKEHPRGLQLTDVEIEDAVVDKLIAQSEGDARFLLNQLEWIGKSLGDRKKIDEKLLEEFQYKKPLRYDKNGEEHYNLISALHKSVRGSDPDAAVYWLHRMLQGGEDPRFILRRLMRMAMEDVGLADPNAILLANAAREAFDFMGIPEGLIGLDEVAIYLSLAPKSNSVELAGMKADKIIRDTGTLPVPRAFRNSVTRVGKQLGYGVDYQYDHDSPGAYSAQEHLPKQLEGTVIYEPKPYGKEKAMGEKLALLKQAKKEKNGEN